MDINIGRIEMLSQQIQRPIPRAAAAGLGASYMSGSLNADGQRFAMPEPVAMPSDVDLYIPSIPNLNAGAGYATAPSAMQENFNDVNDDNGNANDIADNGQNQNYEDHHHDHAHDDHDHDHDDHGNVAARQTGENQAAYNNAGVATTSTTSNVDTNENVASDESEDGTSANAGAPETESNNDTSVTEYTPEEQRVIDELQARDREVRAHEQAHIAVGGQYVRGGATYQYERGPDNRHYAVGGEVTIDSSPVRGDPEATIAKMQAVRAAALAPADPSAQDRAVAASAGRAEAEAAAELRELRAAEAEGEGSQNQDSVNDVNVNQYNGDNGNDVNANNNNDNNTDAAQSSRIQSNAAAAYTTAVNFADVSQPILSLVG